MHLRHHQTRQGDSSRLAPVPDTAEKVYEHDGFAVYQIDGEKEKLYCQNLSLFGKLFLENKSVFFDTTGFEYHVLIHTPVSKGVSPTKGQRGRKRGSSASTDDFGLSTQVLGFFSKEKMSWDANNLACILVFPPYQHRQLGKLLMSVSYKLSGWEWMGEPRCAIGGPEKPLSSMGRKSYLRFWSERIARYMMSQSIDSDGKRLFEHQEHADKSSKKKRMRQSKEELTVKEIGERTGMLAEDVIAALTEMDVCEVPTKRLKKKAAEMNGDDGPSTSVDAEQTATMVARRSKVVEWAYKNGVDLEDPVKAEGFIGEWATVDDDDENIDNDMQEAR
jgi:MOZ/SAS family